MATLDSDTFTRFFHAYGGVFTLLAAFTCDCSIKRENCCCREEKVDCGLEQAQQAKPMACWFGDASVSRGVGGNMRRACTYHTAKTTITTTTMVVVFVVIVVIVVVTWRYGRVAISLVHLCATLPECALPSFTAAIAGLFLNHICC